MERLTNKYKDLINEVKKELFSLNIAKNEYCILNYSEIPCFPGGQFSLFLLRDFFTNQYKIVEKNWDNEYDCERFSSGVYNLDRLCIKTKVSELSSQQQQQLENLIASIKIAPATLESDNYILLDGIEYGLTIKTKAIDKNYKWKVATKDLQYFTPLIDLVRTHADE